MRRKVVIIAGPTCCGKTDYSIKYVKNCNAKIINCDSLQMYRNLKILTAFPVEYELYNIEHKLFGFLEDSEKITVYDWATLATREIEKTFEEDKVPIIVGGTGFFINTLINGISTTPAVSHELRQNAEILAKNDYEALCQRVYDRDPRLREIIPKSRRRQMVRAYEIMTSTGKSVLHFHDNPKTVFIRNVFYEFNIMITDRQALYSRIDKRVDRMLENGAIEEVQALLSRFDIKMIDKYPIFNAIGAKEVASYLRGERSHDAMVALIKLNTRHYAKRQVTWFKHQVRESDCLRIRWLEN